MISAEDVKDRFPQAAGFDGEALQTWVDVANTTIDQHRVKDVRTLDLSRILFVMHHMEKPPVNLAAPHVVARTNLPGRRGAFVKAPHPWAGTPHGEQLIKATR